MKKTVEQIKEELIKDLSEASDFNGLARAFNGVLDDVNHLYYKSKTEPELNFDRPPLFLFIDENEKIVAKDNRMWKSSISYMTYAVYSYLDTEVIRSMSYFDTKPPVKINDRRKEQFWERNGFKLKGYVTKAKETLTPLLDSLPSNMDDVNSNFRIYSIENHSRELGYLYYDKDGNPTEPFNIPSVMVGVNSVRFLRDSFTEKWADPVNSSSPPENDILDSDVSESEALMKLVTYMYFDQFERTKGFKHREGILLKDLNEEIKFEFYAASIPQKHLDTRELFRKHRKRKRTNHS